MWTVSSSALPRCSRIRRRPWRSSWAVRRQFHRQGIGHRLIAASEQFARDAACRLLTVKTLAPRDREEPQYAATCAFYEGSGFIRAEVFPKFWHEDFPCLFLVKPLDRRLS